MMIPKARWHLRTSLTWLLVVTSAIAFLIAFALLLAYYAPQFAQQTQRDLTAKSRDLAARSETVLALLQNQLELLALTASVSPADVTQRQMQSIVSRNGFSTVYQIEPAGSVIRVASARSNGRKKVQELLGSDLSNDRLRRQVIGKLQTVVSDKYLSPASQGITVAIGVWTGRDVIIGEIPLSVILNTVTETSNPADWSIWVSDSYGDLLADTENQNRVGAVNITSLPIFASARNDQHATGIAEFEGKSYNIAVARSDVPNWYFFVRSPSGLRAPKLRTAIELGATALVSLILLSVILAPLWASRMARPIHAVAGQARRVADGEAGGQWPRSPVIELDALAKNLERMANAIQEREQELEVIFQFSPVGLLLTENVAPFAFLRANDTTLRLLGYERDEILGKNGTQLGLWADTADRDRLVADILSKHAAQAEVWLVRKDGSRFLAFIQARVVLLGGQARTIWVAEDVTELRQIEREVRELNIELEARVNKRTEELRQANHQLSSTLENLQRAQSELVRSEKLASLGSLVAGVAHELNTPIGNGVMALSTLRGALKTFRQRSADGLKRSALDAFVDAVDTGSNIAERNLQRAAELVTGFKQVAADQTSSQRRSFQLDEVINEIILTLRPTLRHSVAELMVDIPSGIVMDSYPGPLGQIITNLISNATMHAFSEREHGTIRLFASPPADGRLRLMIADDGVGIPAELLPRIFDPFVTSRMGRGGTGLGLHIAHNIAAQVLGGNITASSIVGQGTTFELDIPLVAPAGRSTG